MCPLLSFNCWRTPLSTTSDTGPNEMTRAAGSTSPGGTNRATLKRTSTEGKLAARKGALKTTVSQANQCFLNSTQGVPGWLSWLSDKLLILAHVWIAGCEIEPGVGLLAERGDCLGFSLCPSPLLVLTHSLSQNKCNLKKKSTQTPTGLKHNRNRRAGTKKSKADGDQIGGLECSGNYFLRCWVFRVCTMVCTMCTKSHVEVYHQYLRIRPYLEWSVQRELVKMRPHWSRTGPQSSVCPKEEEVDTDTWTGRTPGEDGRCWIDKRKPRHAKTGANHQKLTEGPGTDGPSQPSGGSSPADASRLRH